MSYVHLQQNLLRKCAACIGIWVVLIGHPSRGCERTRDIAFDLANFVMCDVGDGIVYVTAMPAPNKIIISADNLDGIFAVVRDVKHFSIASQRIDEKALKVLAKQKALEIASFQGVNLTDSGLKVLARSESLRVLTLVGTEVTDDGLLALGKMNHLRYLYLLDNRTTEDAVEAIKKRLPKCKIVSDVVKK